MGFTLDGMAELKKARDELATHVKPQLLNRYERVSKSYERTVVPVVSELCTGCFAKVATSFRYEKNTVVSCENCGRILYFI
jgi:predicted  nucleic acid-binding Zn-ribbon protein